MPIWNQNENLGAKIDGRSTMTSDSNIEQGKNGSYKKTKMTIKKKR